MADRVKLFISSNVSHSQFAHDRRYPRKMLVSVLKGRLELVTGVQCKWMELELYDDEGNLMHKLADEQNLRYYSPQNNWRVHVIDKNPKRTEEELFTVEKYTMSDEDYMKREVSVMKYMIKNRIGRFSEDVQKKKELAKEKRLEEYEKAKLLNVGDRCETTVPNEGIRRGSIQYIGETGFGPGCWVGVMYDEPVGKNDGSVEGKRYFTCENKHGGIVRPGRVKVGDFPEEDIGLDVDDEM